MQASTIIQRVYDYHKEGGTQISTLLLQALMYYKYQEDFDAFAPQAISNLRLLPYYSSALNLISHPAFPKEEKLFDTKLITHGLLQMELKIRRLHVDIASSARLSGTVDDIFPIISRQLQKDKMCDNLSVDVLEYLKELLRMGVQLIEMKEKDLIASLKVLVEYQSQQVGDIKKELLGSVNKTLRQTPLTESTVNTKEGAKLGVKNVVSTSSIAELSAATTTNLSSSTSASDHLYVGNTLEFPMGDALDTSNGSSGNFKEVMMMIVVF